MPKASHAKNRTPKSPPKPKPKCNDCGGLLTKRSPLYEQGVCLWCVRRDSVPAYSYYMRKRNHTL